MQATPPVAPAPQPLGLDQPVPFEIIERDGVRVASNGLVQLALLEADGTLKRRRAITGVQTKPPAETMLPLVNALAGELLQRLDMPAQEVAARLLALAGLVPLAKPRNVEWAVVELDGVRVYANGNEVLVTRQDLWP